MGKSQILLIALFLFSICLVPLTSSIDSEQSFQYDPQLAAYTGSGYVIAPITIPIGKIGEDLSLWFRVYDTNGKIIPTTQSNVECSAFLFTPNADRIYRLDGNDNITAVSVTGRKATFPASFINITGDYNWFVGCEGVVTGGAMQGFLTITNTGRVYDESEALSYLIVLFALILFLAATGYGAIALPYSNKSNDNGDIIGVNDLKYVKVLLIGLSYGILVWIANIMITISNNYIHLGVAMKFFELMFRMMTALTYPLLIGFIIFIVIRIVKDFSINKLLGRGFTA